MIKVLRQEEKYPLNLLEAIQYKHYFSKVLKTDAYSAGDSYMVRSLYFDTAYDEDFFDKVTEQNNRRKIRLRIYSPQEQFAKLEEKKKTGVYQQKRSLRIAKEDAIGLINRDYSVLLKYPEAFAEEMYLIMSSNCYMPRTVIEYQRCAFMCQENNIRLTFDSNICATESSVDLFAQNLPLYPIYDRDKVIFEVKYDRFLLSYVKDIISKVDRRNITSSKYCLGRSIGYPLQL